MSISNNTELHFDQNFDNILLNKLQEELRILKYENSDLKFQLQLAKGDSIVYKYYLQSDGQIRSEELEKELNSHKEKICTLEADLEETRRLLEDAKWAKMMTQNLLKTKKFEFDELQNEKQNVTNKNHTSLNRSASEDLFISKRSNSARDKSHQYQSMTTINNHNQHYKKGLAPLPHNYKNFVSSLPPINQAVIVINGREKILVN